MKSILPFLALVLLLLTFTDEARASSNMIQLFLNGEKLETPAEMVSLRDTTFVPVRLVAEGLGAKVTWVEESRKVIVEQEKVNIELFIDQEQATVNGREETLAVAPFIRNGSTMVPLRFISERLGMRVTWDNFTRSVYLFQADSSLVAGVRDDAPDEETPQPGSPPAPDKPDLVIPVTPVPQNPPPPGGTNGGSSAVNGLPRITGIAVANDRILITSTSRLQSNSFYLDKPDRLVIDFPVSVLGDTINGLPATQNGEIVSLNASVKAVRYANFSSEPPTVRIVIDLNKRVDHTISFEAATNQTIISFGPEKRYTVVLDAGHGGKDVGAISFSDLYEKHFTLSVTKKVERLLGNEPRISAVMVRTQDTTISLDDIVKRAGAANGDLFISIHGNSFADDLSISGTETYYSRADSLPFAQLVHAKLLEATGFKDRGVRRWNFKVIRESKYPAVLLEIGYLSNPTEEKQLLDDAMQEKIAAAIVASIKQYFKLD